MKLQSCLCLEVKDQGNGFVCAGVFIRGYCEFSFPENFIRKIKKEFMPMVMERI